MDNLNISSVVSDSLCTGCGTCSSLCPKNAIKMTLNSDKGIFLPELNKKLCDYCGICYKICPGHEVDFNSLNLEIFGKLPEDQLIGNHTDFFIGHSLNDEIRYNSSSGGLITQFLIFALEKKIIDGALVTRMSKENPLIPETFIARTKNEIIESSKSKYCPVPANIALKKILESPDDEKFAVVGLPCHIHGIRKAEKINKKINKKIKLHLGIICNHTPSFHATEFILKNHNLNKKDLKEINYRGEGWPGAMKITLTNDEKISIPHFSTQYWGAIFNSFFFPYRCTVCTDKSCKLADISFADAWTPDYVKKDSKGTSLIIMRKNEQTLNELKKHMALHHVSDKILMESQQLNRVKRRISAQIKIYRFFRGNTPQFIEKEINVGLSDYSSAIFAILKNFLTKSEHLVKIYLVSYKKASKLKSKIF